MAKSNNPPNGKQPLKEPYLTKRVLGRAIEKATKHIKDEAFRLRGYMLIEEKGWIVKVDKAGKKTRVSPLETVAISNKIILD